MRITHNNSHKTVDMTNVVFHFRNGNAVMFIHNSGLVDAFVASNEFNAELFMDSISDAIRWKCDGLSLTEYRTPQGNQEVFQEFNGSDENGM